MSRQFGNVSFGQKWERHQLSLPPINCLKFQNEENSLLQFLFWQKASFSETPTQNLFEALNSFLLQETKQRQNDCSTFSLSTLNQFFYNVLLCIHSIPSKRWVGLFSLVKSCPFIAPMNMFLVVVSSKRDNRWIWIT